MSYTLHITGSKADAIARYRYAPASTAATHRGEEHADAYLYRVEAPR